MEVALVLIAPLVGFVGVLVGQVFLRGVNSARSDESSTSTVCARA